MNTRATPATDLLPTAGKFGDLFLVAGLLMVVALMVLRLPTGLIDALVAANIAIGIGLLLVAIYIPAPVAFNTFPSVLLVTTLFRLSLSVATTRLILLEADAGDIIDAFGNFVAGGNLVVGIVVFVIITVVQFIVIAKGAERVAEVAARFTLDAMPGKQMSIDSDLRSGLIDQDEAKTKRKLLEKESQLNGALDGAMKFVKGDAIAGIIIVLVNLIGGLTIGVFQHDLPANEAMQVYSILTIGDGMVAQVPALLGTMAAGLVVTRTAGENDDMHLGQSIGRQLGAQPRALLVTGFIALLLSAVPGFPTLIFLGLAIALFAAVYLVDPTLFSKLRRKKAAERATAAADELPINDPARHVTQPLVLEFGRDAARYLSQPDLRKRIFDVQHRIGNELGISIPELQYQLNSSLPAGSYRLLVFDVMVADGDTRQFTAEDNKTSAIASPVEDQLEETVEAILRGHAADFLGIQEVSELLETAGLQYEALLKIALNMVPLQNVAVVFRNLVAEGIPLRNLRDILEALAAWGDKESDPDALTEFARMGLKRYMTERYVPVDKKLPALVVHPALEEQLRQAITTNAAGTVLNIEPGVVGTLTDNLRGLLETLTQSTQKTYTVLITAVDIRRYVKQLIASEFPGVAVLSYQELALPVNIVPLGQLSIEQNDAEKSS